MHLGGDGNVGVGTTTPAYRLDVSGVVNATGILINGAPFAGGGSQWATSGSNISYASASGNVGIGTASPAYKLDVNGAVNATSLYINGSPFTGTSQWTTSGTNISYAATNGNVGIGTTIPDQKLTVKGKIHCQEVTIDLSVPGPDYVFESNYNLPSLEELNAYIKVNKHLPEVPSARTMEEKGVDLGEMNMLLLKKVEELTLYVIEQNKKIEELKKMGEVLKRQMDEVNKK